MECHEPNPLYNKTSQTCTACSSTEIFIPDLHICQKKESKGDSQNLKKNVRTLDPEKSDKITKQ